MKRACNVYGICMEYVWNMHGICIEYAWEIERFNTYGTCMGYA